MKRAQLFSTRPKPAQGLGTGGNMYHNPEAVR